MTITDLSTDCISDDISRTDDRGVSTSFDRREGLDQRGGGTDAGGACELPCQVGEADMWFAEDPAELEAAKALCRQCPLQQPCLAEAIARREPWGVWGGEIFLGGTVVARKRPRGRPRKNAEPATLVRH